MSEAKYVFHTTIRNLSFSPPAAKLLLVTVWEHDGEMYSLDYPCVGVRTAVESHYRNIADRSRSAPRVDATHADMVEAGWQFQHDEVTHRPMFWHPEYQSPCELELFQAENSVEFVACDAGGEDFAANLAKLTDRLKRDLRAKLDAKAPETAAR